MVLGQVLTSSSMRLDFLCASFLRVVLFAISLQIFFVIYIERRKHTKLNDARV